MNSNYHNNIIEFVRGSQSKDSNSLLIFSIEQVLKQAGPREEEVLRRCAIPRWFDIEVLSVLRGQIEGNERVVDLLRGYTFVREIAPNRFSYHDQVRYALLKEWLGNRPNELHELNTRLATHFTERMERNQRVLSCGDTFKAIPINEYDLWQREAIYHLLWADPQQGLEKLHTTFNDLESSHRLAEAEALLQVAAETPLNEPDQLWLTYSRARIQHEAFRYNRWVDGV